MSGLRRFASIVAPLVLAACSSSQQPDSVAQARGAIAYGTIDTTHTAVVALLASAGGGSFSECSGTVVQVKGGVGYVLTAAHCCNMSTPSIVVMSGDYASSEQYLFGGSPMPPAYAVTPGSVYWDSQYDQMTHDFCMLKFAAPAGTPVIPVAQPGADGVAIGVQAETVGFGMTDTTQNNTTRRHMTSPIDQGVTPLAITSSGGGASHTPGTCEGDSGGPVLLPAGATPSSQKVVGTTSYGTTTTCGAASNDTASRVTSETGPGGFITNYLNDTPSGTQAGSAAASCQTCAQSAQSGACSAQAQACANDSKCIALNQCLGSCTTSACVTSCQSTAGTTAVNELNAFEGCVCNTACTSQCATECGSGSGNSCGLQSADANCNTCLDASCCSQGAACAADATCVSCLSSPTAACSSNAAYQAMTSCLSSKCASQCGGGSSTSDAGTGPGTGTDAGTSSGADTGAGTTPTDDAGTNGGATTSAAPVADTSSSGGCSVGSDGATGVGAGAWSFALLAGVFAARRRRAR